MKRALLLERITFAMVLVALVAQFFTIRDNRHLAHQGKQAHDGLCVFKADLRSRVTTGNKFLDSHPGGIAGIPAATLRGSITNEQSTLDSLKIIVCPSDSPATKGKA